MISELCSVQLSSFVRLLFIINHVLSRFHCLLWRWSHQFQMDSSYYLFIYFLMKHCLIKKHIYDSIIMGFNSILHIYKEFDWCLNIVYLILGISFLVRLQCWVFPVKWNEQQINPVALRTSWKTENTDEKSHLGCFYTWLCFFLNHQRIFYM